MLYSRQPRAASALLSLGVIFFTGLLSTVQGTLQCAQPQNGTFKAGDPLILNWSSDGNSPTVQDIKSLSATLNCNSGTPIANVTITNWAVPFPWVVPNVGNATTAGGTMGTCPMNAFYVVYSGVATEKALGFIPHDEPFKISCNSITILPGANNSITTTTTTTTTTTLASTSKSTTTTSSSSSSSSSSSPSPTNSSGDDESSKPKAFIIAIVAIVAGLILFLVAFATWWYLRKQRIKRMENAVMPWSNQPGNQFSKVSSMDEGHRASGSINGAAAVAAVGPKYGSNKAQPMIPQPQKSYYNGEDYGGQHGPSGGYGGGQQGGYENYNNSNNQDEYYNPYYATNRHGYGASPPSSNATYYNNGTPYQDPRDPYQQQAPAGYFPPPPPVVPSTSPVQSTVSQMNTISDITPSSGSLRSPQVILPEKGSPSTEEDIQMKVLVKS
ncbi:hypothetical protein BGX26_001301 [Mortierella sp. AD094]|nr:hypothetical protein BGX26_001301 [Mortierella sp. AD094]